MDIMKLMPITEFDDGNDYVDNGRAGNERRLVLLTLCLNTSENKTASLQLIHSSSKKSINNKAI